MILKLFRNWLEPVAGVLPYAHRGSDNNVRPIVWDVRLIEGPFREGDTWVLNRLSEDRTHPIVWITTAHFRGCSSPLGLCEKCPRENAATTA